MMRFLLTGGGGEMRSGARITELVKEIPTVEFSLFLKSIELRHFLEGSRERRHEVFKSTELRT